MTKRNPEFGGFSACFAVRTETDLDDPDEEDEEISTHSAREDGDQMPLIQWQSSYTFQPTPPARTETYNSPRPVKPLFISTHSAREDGDPQLLHCNISRLDFNPLRPRGRRLYELSKLYLEDIFQPTPPARTETPWPLPLCRLPPQFQPTPPARTETAILHKKTNNSSSHFHNQITSYSLKSPPTYPAHIQSRFHCAVFPVRIPP